MRYNASKKRARYKQDVIKYLVNYPLYTAGQAKQTVNKWISDPTQLTGENLEDIRNALSQIAYDKKYRSQS